MAWPRRRSLLGEAEFHRPVGTVTAQQLSWAQLVAVQMDVLLPLDDEGSADVLLQAGLGWFRTMGGHRSRWVGPEGRGARQGGPDQ